MLLWCVLPLLWSLEGLSGAEPETLCSSNGCLTLQMDKLGFEKAEQSCKQDGGHLVSIRAPREEEELRLLLSRVRGQPPDRGIKLWIGLKLNRRDCVSPGRSLRGFKWVSGQEESHFSNWASEPVPTCTEERCVSIYHSSGLDQLSWTAGSCKRPAFYVCKFIFKGMCRPLTVLGPGQINYTLPFSREPQRRDLPLYPVGTFADISCGDQGSPYSICTGTEGAYRWTEPGPFCRAETWSCAVNNGWCEHLCQADADAVRCLCREGYILAPDGRACLKDWCRPDPCEHRCVRGDSGYSCRCPHGFTLHENQHNCSDIDECGAQVCGPHSCVNSHGGYSCVCTAGFLMAGGQCVDMDECLQPRCEHSCLNSIGSFSCGCDAGFLLSADGRSCADTDECTAQPCGDQRCFNTEGSFFCSCPPGFSLHSDGLTCSPDSTDNPTAAETPANFTDLFSEADLQPHTEAPSSDSINETVAGRTNASLVSRQPTHPRVLVCVLGSLIPLLLLLAVTVAIAVYRCAHSQKQAKKNKGTDGYCWVSSGFDPRLEKLYESILTDDL